LRLCPFGDSDRAAGISEDFFPRLLQVIVRQSSPGFETAVPQRNWEDFSPGSVSEFGPRLVTRDEIVEFAAAFDPQPMHLDEAAASASMLGSLAASGWHSCCLLMRMISDGFLSQSHFIGAPGVDEVRWLRPLRAGESIRVRATVLETRASRSRPQLGFVKFLFELLDSSGTVLMTLTVSPMFARRDAGSVSRDEMPA
jgi:acyl dehydratase